MSDQWLRSHIDDGHCRVVVAGDLDAVNSGEFAAVACAGLRDDSVRALDIDLGAVDFLDSSGLGSLVLALNTAEQLNKPLTVVHIPERVQKLLEITGLDKIFPDGAARSA